VKFQTQASCEPCVFEFRHALEVNLTSELQHLDNFQVAEDCVVLFAVRYFLNPLSTKCHFAYISGADPNMIFVLQRTTPVTTGKSKE